VGQAGAVAPALTRLLVVLFRVPAGPDTPGAWHQEAPSAASLEVLGARSILERGALPLTGGGLTWGSDLC
jgi:hypothetical protein